MLGFIPGSSDYVTTKKVSRHLVLILITVTKYQRYKISTKGELTSEQISSVKLRDKNCMECELFLLNALRC